MTWSIDGNKHVHIAHWSDIPVYKRFYFQFLPFIKGKAVKDSLLTLIYESVFPKSASQPREKCGCSLSLTHIINSTLDDHFPLLGDWKQWWSMKWLISDIFRHFFGYFRHFVPNWKREYPRGIVCNCNFSKDVLENTVQFDLWHVKFPDFCLNGM